MPKMTKKYISWMLSTLMCFSNSFTVIQAEEPVQTEEPDILDVTEEEQINETGEEAIEIIEEISEETTIIVEEEQPENDDSELYTEENVESGDSSPEEIETTEDYEINISADDTEEKTAEETKTEEETIAEEDIEDSDVFEVTSSTFTYIITNEEAEITKYTGTDAEVEIPSEINSFPVRIIGNRAFEGNENITNVTIPDGVIKIGDYAFNCCRNLIEISIPDSVTKIGMNAFSTCDNLISIILPSELTVIESCLFEFDYNLVSVTIPDSINTIKNGAFEYCEKLQNIRIPDGVTSIESNTFSNCRSLNSIIIPDSVVMIGSSAFESCTNLSDITIPDGVTSIGYAAFLGCSKLVNINIPEGITSLEYEVFSYCSSLVSIVIPDSVTSIGNSAFSDCISLSSIILPEGLQKISYQQFYNCTSLTNVQIPSSVTSINSMAFQNCTSLERIVIPENVTSIDSLAFYGCTSLSEIILPSSLQTIGSNAFSGCPAAEGWADQNGFNIVNHILIKYTGNASSVTIPTEVTSISESAFSGNQTVTSIVIPSGVTSIGGSAFYNCTNLTSVEIPNTVTSIGSYAFWDNTSLTSITLPNSVIKIGSNIFASCINLKNVVLPNQLQSIPYQAFYNCKNLTTVQLPGDLQLIDENAFQICTGLTSISLPDHTVTISKNAFLGCTALKTVVLNNELETISESAFSGCSELSTINFPNSLKTIGSKAFYNCAKLTFDAIPANVSVGSEAFKGCTAVANSSGFIISNRKLITYLGSDTEITIPNSVDEICANAFYNYSNLIKVTIPTSVYKIGSSAFYGCSSLTEITIPYGVEVIGKYVFAECKSLSKVALSANLTEIGYGAFMRCTSLTSIKIPSKVTTLGESIFLMCSGLTNITLPSDIKIIPVQMFSGCSSLTSIDLPQELESIKYGAFQSCGLTSVKIPNSVTLIDGIAFGGCKSLTSISLPQGIKDIRSSAFAGCSALRDVYYSGIRSQWDAISIGSNNEPLLTASLHLAEIGEHEAEGYQPFPTYGAGPTEAGKYVLAEDTVLSGTWTVPQGETTLCLHGHTITSNSKDPYRIIIANGSRLSIEDCSADQTGYIDFYSMKVENTAGGYTWVKPAIAIEEGGSFVMNGGMIGINSGCPSYYNSTLIELQGGSAEINGGTIVYSTYTNNTTNNRITAIGGTGTVLQSGGTIKVRATILDFDFRQSMYGIAANGDITITGGEIVFEKNQNLDGTESKYKYPIDISSGGHLYLAGSQNYDGYISVGAGTESVTAAVNGSYYTGTTKILVTQPDTLVPVINGVEEAVKDHFSLWKYEKYYFYSVSHFYYDHKIYKGDSSVRYIALDQTDVTVLEGETVALSATVTDWKDDVIEDSLSWSSSDPEVASVDENGLVTALTPGTAIITASDGTQQAQCTVTVEENMYRTLTILSNGGLFFAGTENETESDQELQLLKGQSVGEAAGNIIDALTKNNASPTGYTADDNTVILTADQAKGLILTKNIVLSAVWQSPEYEWTEADDGYTVTASVNGYPGNEETVYAIKEVVHEVNCEEPGFITYTAEFSNPLYEKQMKEISQEALGHDYQFAGFVWAGNDADGYTEAYAEYVCTNDDQHVQTAVGTVEVQRTEPTCETDGSVVYTASLTDEETPDGKARTDSKTVVLPALGHDYAEPGYTWNGTADGYTVTAETVCSHDHSHVVTETVHASYEVIDAPGCEESGTGRYTAEFESDLFTAQTKEITLKALGHDYQFSEFKWTGNDRTGYTASAEYVCTHDSAHKQTKEAEITSVRTEPTCETAGSIVYTVTISEEDSIDGKAHSDTKTVVLAATGHNYDTPQYEWEETANGYRVKATAVCRNDESHILSETVNAVYQVTKAPTCEMTGTGVYTASFSNTQFRKQTKTVMIPATGHEYGEPEYTWIKTDEGYTVTAKTVCQNDNSHVVTETVTAGFEMIDDPSQENKTGLYTAEFENELFEMQTKIWTFVSSIQIDQAEVTFHSLDETVTLHAAVLPESADNRTYHWESSDETIAVVDENGVITPVSNGTTVVKAVTEEGSLEAECTVIVDIQTTGIEIEHTEYTVERGETVQLSVVVTPEEANNKGVSWTTSDPKVVVVDRNGLVTAVKSGTAVITAKTEDTGIEAECIIHVITSGRSVSLEESQITVSRGETVQLHAEIEPADADNLKLNWKSSDETVAIVDENGLVKAVERGEAVITVTAEDGNSSAQCVVSVDVPALSFTLNDSVLDMIVGETHQLSVTVEPEDADISTLIWTSSHENVVTVDQEGNVTALSKGMAVVSVETQDGQYRETCLIKTYVQPTEISYQSDIIRHNMMFLSTGDAYKVENVTIIPEEASEAPLQYVSSNTQVAWIGHDGIIHAVSNGTAIISIQSGDVSTSFTVMVTDDLQTAMNNCSLVDYIIANGSQSDSHYTYEMYLDKDNENLVQLEYYPETQKIMLGLTYINSDTSATSKSINVTYEYYLNDLTEVEIRIRSESDTARMQEVKGDIICGFNEVNLSESLGYTITSVPSTLSVMIAQPVLDYALSAGTMAIEIALNDIGTSLNALGFKSIDLADNIETPAYVVNHSLVDFIVANGSTTDKVYYYQLYIDTNKEQTVRFEYNPSTDKLSLIYHFAKDKSSTAITSVHISMSYDIQDLATVDIVNMVGTSRLDVTQANGSLTCGFDEVTVSHPLPYTTSVIGMPYYDVPESDIQSMLDTTFKTGIQMIENILNRNGFSLYSLGFTSIGTSTNVSLTDLSVKPTRTTIYVGDTAAITAVKYPSNANANLVWSSGNTSVATVDQSGNVRALSEGTAVITVKSAVDGTIKATCTVTVKKPVNVTGIMISSTVSSVNVGETILLSAQVSPSNATNKSYSWTSSNNSIATVDQKGIVRGVSTGKAVIQAVSADGHYTASKTITVTIPLASIGFAQKEVKLAIRDSVQVDPVFTPENASNKNLNWKSLNDRIAMVDQNGKVTAVSEGETTIVCTAEDGGYTAHYQLKAYTVYAEGIHIESGVEEIEFGDTGTIRIVFEPENTTNQNLIWSSSDENIAIVDENGNVTAVGEGPVTITAVSEDGGFIITKEILIHYTHIESVTLDKEKADLLAGDTIALKATILPENSSNKKLIYKSQNTGIANVDENGVITGVSQGKTVITVTSEDGSKTAECTVTIHPRAIYVKEIPTQRYTGKAIKPELKVYDSGILLVQGKDYTVAYKNNTKAADKDALKAPSAIIKMVKKGNYAGSQTVTFTIEPISLEEDNPEITLDALSVQATGKKLSPVPNVYWNGKKLKNKTDYTVNYMYDGWNQTDAGTYLVEINGKGNYAGSRIIPVTVSPKGGKVSVSKLKVTAAAKPFRELTGNFKKDILSCLTVKNGKTDLYLDRDYNYVEGTAVGCETIGSCKFNIRGLKGYEGERTVTVKITGTSLTDKKVTEVNTAVYKYNGEPQKLSANFKLRYNGLNIDSSNYEILEDTYQNNINAGTASVVIEGRNEYYGRRTVKFVIQPVTSGFSGNDITIEKAYYTKGGSTPEVSVKGLTKDDYIVTYQNNKAVGIGTAIITGKGNYKGLSLSKSFRIEKKDIAVTTLTVKDKVFSSKAGGYKSTPVLKDTDGKTLKAGTDYLKDIKYEKLDNNGNVLYLLGTRDTVPEGGLVRVTVTGTGNYTGSITAEYRILFKGMDISKAKVSAATKEYTGNEITLGEEDLVVKVGTAVLTYGEDYEIIEDSYTKNINKGTATVMIRGINDYGGVKTVKFKISQRNINNYWDGIKDFLSRLF